MTHNDRFMLAIGYLRESRYDEALELYQEPQALQSDLRVIERRIEQQMGKDANRSVNETQEK